jgi:hypothetical protein
MRYRGGGVGHLGTRHCDKVLLADEHAPPDASDIVEPSTKPDGDRDSDDEAEGWRGEDEDEDEDEDEGNDENGGEDNNDEQVVAASHDLDIVTAAGFGVL